MFLSVSRVRLYRFAEEREGYREEQVRKMTFGQCVELFLPNKLEKYKKRKTQVAGARDAH